MNRSRRAVLGSVVAVLSIAGLLRTSLIARGVSDHLDTALTQDDPAVPAVQPEQKADQQKESTPGQPNRLLVKTYHLKYIRVSELMQSAKFYVMDHSGTENTLTVRIFESYVPQFEALLKTLDVEKANIQFQVYTIIASKDEPQEEVRSKFSSETQGIGDKELRKVLDEMKGLWNFKHYRVGSPSFLIIKDGSGRNTFRLVSEPYDFTMDILHVSLRGDKPGSRIVSVGQVQLVQAFSGRNAQETSTLIDTSDLTLKEGGYLVVGVSGFTAGWSGMALVLVIRAEIK
jgi:hypothetical protein